jgi:hypothetical protein
MESVACLRLLMSLSDANEDLCVAFLCGDDDSSMKAFVAWSLNDLYPTKELRDLHWPKTASGKGKKVDRGRLPLWYYQPEWLADPQHRTKCYAGAFFKYFMGKNELKMTKCDCLRLKRNFGYFLALHRNTATEEEFEDASKAVLEHHWNNHDHCGAEWCPYKKKMEVAAEAAAAAAGDVESQGVAEAPTETASKATSSTAKFRNKLEQPELYALMKGIHGKYTTPVRLHEVFHAWSTQKNEAMNQCFTKYAPKGRDYSGSGSLFRRICTGVGVVSVGLLEYYPAVFSWLGCKDKLPTEQTRFFASRDKKNAYHYNRKCMTSVKRKRAEAKTEDMKVQAKEGASTSKNEGNDYRPGMALEIDMGDDGATPVATATNVKKCSRCGGTDHQRSNSKKCRYYKERSLPSSECVSFRVLLCCCVVKGF